MNQIIGKIWLTTGEVKEFSWYPEFYAARAFYEENRQLLRFVVARW